MQNLGLTISPLIAGAILKSKETQGYFWFLTYFDVLALIGIVLNVWLYVDDLKNRGGILNRVDKNETLEERRATENEVQQMRVELSAQEEELTKTA